MAEIILPPEENEETPQVPELNIDKPTDNSKVITIEFEAKKTNKVSTKDTNQQLYTTDTDAWFEFKETSLEGANGTYSVVFRNRHDGSIFQRTGDVVGGVAYYKIPHQEIRHAGAWRGQVVYTLSNGDTTSREFGYDVKGHILDGKDVREIVVEDFETLMSQLRSMKDNAEVELANLVNTANQNETDRQVFFDDLIEDIELLQANYQELLDTGVLQTNINTKLEALEEEYAPKLTEVTAQLAQTVRKNEIFTSDYNGPVELDLKDFSGYNQPFHPSVLYLENGFSGYKYWLVQSPYPIGGQPYRDRWEVPVVYKSNDGIDWITVADPLDDLTQSEINNFDYMSDPHLVYREDTNTLEVWYRITETSSGRITRIVRKTSADGENWSDRETMIPGMVPGSLEIWRSPSVLWDNSIKRYRVWYTNDHGVFYSSSPDGKVWSSQMTVYRDKSHRVWHLDVNYYDGKYHLLSYSSSSRDIYYYESADGINFIFVKIIMAENDGNPLYSKGLYRAVSIKDGSGKVRLYTSAVKEENETAILLIIANSLEEIEVTRKIRADRIAFDDDHFNADGFDIASLSSNQNIDTSKTDIEFNRHTSTGTPISYVDGGKIYLKNTGTYMIIYKVFFSANTIGDRRLFYGNNDQSKVNASASQATILESLQLVTADRSDFPLNISVNQSSGQNLDILGGTSLTNVRIIKL